MSELFRSSSMVYARLLVTDEAAYDTIKQLAMFGKAHVVDLSLRHGVSAAPSERLQHYKKRIALAQYYERKLDNFRQLFDEYQIEQPSPDVEAAGIPPGDVLEQLKAYLEPLEWTVTKDVLSAREQQSILTSLREHECVLREVGALIAASGGGLSSNHSPRYGTFDQEQRGLLSAGSEMDDTTDEEKGDAVALTQTGYSAGGHNSSSNYRIPMRSYFSQRIHGVISEERAPMFERMVFRVSRGNAVTKTKSIPRVTEAGASGAAGAQGELKRVFSLTFVGDVMAKRLRKIIAYFGGTEYEVPLESNDAQRKLISLLQRINDAKQLLAASEQQVRYSLRSIAWDRETNRSPYVNYLHALRMEKAICDTLRKCELERSTLRCECWIPEADLPDLAPFLKAATSQTGLQPAAVDVLRPEDSHGQHLGTPPTFFPTNKFTAPYQGIVDTYGVPRYKEANPGLFTIISFPFLFGVMYGDIGHGLLVTLGALFFIWREKYYLREQRLGRMEEITGMVFGGRYLLLLMGLFAVYAGWIYNDCFSIPVALSHSRWIFSPQSKEDPANSPLVGEHDGTVYPFGVDPGWYHTSNGLAFFNSLKMKLAVTLGVAQMLFGIVLGALNNRFFRDRAALLFEFLPRLTFMCCTFGYMVVIVLYKFTVDWRQRDNQPPNLVQTMIAMFLAPGSVDADKELYSGQAAVQSLLLLLALLSVPVMLLAQPLLARREHLAIFGKRKSSDASHSAHYERVGTAYDEEKSSDSSSSPAETAHVAAEVDGGDDSHGTSPRSSHWSFSDALIISGIHTVEFVLGAVSNTASYLRLWALSLAHAQLSEVFWSKMIMQYGIHMESPIFLVIGVAIWAGATFGVLLCMDLLECFLHALRLHWVEYQNKFFHGDGIAYQPFNFEHLEEDAGQ